MKRARLGEGYCAGSARDIYRRAEITTVMNGETVTSREKAKDVIRVGEPEWKAIDCVYAPLQVLGYSGNAYLLNGCVRGGDDGERDGEEITMLSVDYNAYLDKRTLSSNMTFYRVLLVYDRQANGGAIDTASLMSAGGTEGPISFLSKDNVRRYEVLRDTMGTFGAYYSPNTAGMLLSEHVELNRPALYGLGNTGTYADISSGALWLVFYADDVGVYLNLVKMASRVNYMG